MEAQLQAAVAQIHEPWGGALCLDFANTLEPRGGPPPFVAPAGMAIRDELPDYLGLVAWAIAMGTVDASVGRRLLQVADRDARAAAGVLGRARSLRDAIYRVFWATARAEPAPAADLDMIRKEYVGALAHATLTEGATGVAWSWRDDDPSLDRPLWAVVRSAVDLLLTGERDRVRVCPGVAGAPMPCAWLFFDRTKNRSRRSRSCCTSGGATKARRQTSRRRLTRRGKREDSPDFDSSAR